MYISIISDLNKGFPESDWDRQFIQHFSGLATKLATNATLQVNMADSC